VLATVIKPVLQNEPARAAKCLSLLSGNVAGKCLGCENEMNHPPDTFHASSIVKRVIYSVAKSLSFEKRKAS
jgi:hypothetical protein